ncbi:MAG TPA: BTAD domain-containing putative transcriptional regulator [Ideonella sp.]|uniref:BTAD domain-containing putative transcriptional regulator n=1 Tax=Ideonella sp. TaxID=1929293 RepID=UPI002E307720|nr:BTAD domain-containing putative transcriptional regulator [Ideonella sp.]HEX5684059.1 BTAD domain-containing putative transcriptional regulator [Ideonella sp.]
MALAPTEQELAASCLSLLAQPALWPQLRLPPPTTTRAAEAPWATYWATRVDAALDVAEARALLEAAFAAFTTQQDRLGELLCLAAIIESYYVDEGPLEPLDGWIDQLASRLPDRQGCWASQELEARVLACGVGILLRDQAHPLLAGWAERGATLVRQLKPGASRLKLATFLAQYHLWRGEFSRASLIVDALPGLDMSGLLPGEALVWLETLATHARYAAQPERGREAIDAALQLVRQHGLREHKYALHAHGAALALAAQDAPAARQHLDAMRPVLDRGPQADQTHYWHFHAGLALLEGDAAQAVELARAALDNSAEIGGPFRTATHALSLGQALLVAGETSTALAAFERALVAARPIGAELLVFTALLMRAACLQRLDHGDEALSDLRIAWGEGARRGFRTTAVWWLPQVMAELARLALAHDIEPAFVRRFVRQHGLPGPDATVDSWPWPLLLRGFGEFEVTLHDMPLARSVGKTAQRPLDLLRALLAHGDSPLPVATALDWLWPDAEPAAQRKSFDVALLRLRRMLDDPRLVHLEGGRLFLDPRWAWSDAGALHGLMQQIGSAHAASLPRLRGWGQQLLGLMRGPFLVGEDADWVQAARQRYRQRFVITIAQLASHMEPLDPAASVQLYERALDIEPLAESLSRRLMRLHSQLGQHAEALRAWRACCTMLDVAAGIGPSDDTRRLAAELGLPAWRP